MQVALEDVRGPLSPHLETDGVAITVHCGYAIVLGPATDWAELLLELAEIDPTLDDDLRWDEALAILQEAASVD